jgi:hypothetical protein
MDADLRARAVAAAAVAAEHADKVDRDARFPRKPSIRSGPRDCSGSSSAVRRVVKAGRRAMWVG